MDKSVLLKMSQEVLVIPFEENIASMLDDFCRSQISGVDYDRMAELIFCFLLRKNDEDIEGALLQYMEDHDLQGKLSARVIMPVLIEYIVLLLIDEAETEGQKATFSLMLKNALLGVVKGVGHVIRPEVILPIFGKYMMYLDEEKTFVENEAERLLPRFLDAPSETTQFVFKEAGDAAKIKSLMYDAASYRYQNLVDNLILTEGSVIGKVYDLVDNLVNESPWMYVDRKPAQTIKKLFVKQGIDNVAVEIKDIVAELTPIYSESETVFNSTSIILSLIKGGEDICKVMSDGNKIELMDFAVYLYYELQAERMMEENKIEEEAKDGN